MAPNEELGLSGARAYGYHHTADDTLDRLSPEHLRQNVAPYVTVAYVLAEMEHELGRSPEWPED